MILARPGSNKRDGAAKKDDLRLYERPLGQERRRPPVFCPSSGHPFCCSSLELSGRTPRSRGKDWRAWCDLIMSEFPSGASGLVAPSAPDNKARCTRRAGQPSLRRLRLRCPARPVNSLISCGFIYHIRTRAK